MQVIDKIIKLSCIERCKIYLLTINDRTINAKRIDSLSLYKISR